VAFPRQAKLQNCSHLTDLFKPTLEITHVKLEKCPLLKISQQKIPINVRQMRWISSLRAKHLQNQKAPNGQKQKSERAEGRRNTRLVQGWLKGNAIMTGHKLQLLFP